MKTIAPHPITTNYQDTVYGTDPHTGETYYILRSSERILLWSAIIILCIAHLWVAFNAIKYVIQIISTMETTQKTVYISGPVSNIPHGNVTAFAEATKAVRNMGHIAKNPHEFCQDIPKSSPWETYMRRCIKQLMDCTDIVLLPGWERSDGASIEQMIGTLVGITVHDSLEAFRNEQLKKREEAVQHG